MKKYQFTVWPYIAGHIPAIRPIVIQDYRGKDINLLFRSCNSVDSTGLNLLLVNILNVISHSSNIFGWTCDSKLNESVNNYIRELGFFNILSNYGKTPDLFWGTEEFSNNIELNIKPIIYKDMFNIVKTSYPIISIPFERFDKRRDALILFKEKLYSIFSDLSSDYYFSFEHFISILSEIVKNSADHTDKPCFFGLDTYTQNKDVMKITFSIGDLGSGISVNIRDYFSTKENIKKISKWSFSDSYKMALQTGMTTKPTSLDNKGIGMSIIANGAKNIGMKLTIFDANSGFIVSDIDISKLSHKNIRENFYSFNKNLVFSYYGEMIIRRRNVTY